MSSVIADLMVNLIANDIQLVGATQAAGEKLERLGEQAVKMQTTIKGSFTEAGFAAESMAVKIEESAQQAAQSMKLISGGMQAELASVRSLAAQRDAVLQESWQAELAGWHEQVAAVQKLAQQKAAAVIAAEREAAAAARQAAAEQAAADREAAAVAREAAANKAEAERIWAAAGREAAADMAAAEREAAAERLATEREVDAEISRANQRVITEQRQREQDRAMLAREAAEAERQAVNEIEKERIAFEKAKQEELKLLELQQKRAEEASAASFKSWQVQLKIMGDVGEAAVKLGNTFRDYAKYVYGVGDIGANAFGKLGMTIGYVGGIFAMTFKGIANVAGMVVDGVEKIGLSVAALGTVAVVAAAKFDQLMLRTVTMAQAPLQGANGLDRMKQAVLDLSSAVGQTPDEMAKALYHIESLGLQGSAALDMLKRSAQEAALSGANLEDVATAMGAVFRAGLKDITSTTDAAAALNTITGIGNMTMQDLTSAIGTGILPTVRAAGLTMRDFGAALALATDNGEQANQASTRLRQTLAMISTASLQPKKIEMFASIGMQADQMAKDLNSGDHGLSKAIHDLKDHLEAAFGKDAVEQLKTYNAIMESDGEQAADDWAEHTSKAAQVVNQIFGGARSSGMINLLLEQSDQLDKNYQKYGTTAEANARFTKSWAEETQQLSFQWQQFKSSIEAIFVRIGEKLIPAVQRLLGFLHQMGKDIVDAWGGDKAASYGQQFATVIKKLSDDFIPWLKKQLMDLRDFIVKNKDKIDELARFIMTNVIPAMETLAKGGIKLVIDSIKNLMTFIFDLTLAWERHREAIRVILHAMVDIFLGGFDDILKAAAITFSWIPTVGNHLAQAEKDFSHFKDFANKSIDEITSEKHIYIDEIYTPSSGPGISQHSDVHVGGKVGYRASGGPIEPFQPYIVGEDGPELLYLNTSGYVIPNNDMASHLGARSSASPKPADGGGGGVQLVEARVFLDGRELYSSIIQLAQRYKYRNGVSGVI